MGLPDIAYMGPKLTDNPWFGRSCGTSQLAIGSFLSIRFWSSESNHGGGIELRGDVTEVVLVRNFGSWDTLFIGYSVAVNFHTCEIKINSWTTRAKRMRGSMPPKYEVLEVLKTLEKAELESKLPIYDDGRMIVEESHLALKDDMRFSTRKNQAPFGSQELELQLQGRKLDAAGILHIPLTEYKVTDSTTPSPLSVGTPEDKKNLPVENRFIDAL